MASDISKVTLADAIDPTGHGQPCKQVMYDETIGSGLYVFQHGGNLLAAFHGNPSPSAAAAAVFEEVGGKVRIQEG